MKLEVGKRYVRRDRTISPPLVEYKHNPVWVLDTETWMAFDPTNEEFGWMVFPFTKGPFSFDLMQEYEE